MKCKREDYVMTEIIYDIKIYMVFFKYIGDVYNFIARENCFRGKTARYTHVVKLVGWGEENNSCYCNKIWDWELK